MRSTPPTGSRTSVLVGAYGMSASGYSSQTDASTATPVDTAAGTVSSGVDAELADAPAA
jgi:hypothetical protein